MTREEKNQFIDNLSERLNENSIFYLADVSELTVEQSNKLRKNCFGKNISLQVVKNTLLKKAMEKTGNTSYEELFSVLKGNTSIMFSEVGNAPAKVIQDFRKKNKKPILKAAYVEESIYIGDDQLSILSDLKSKEELIGEIIGLLQSPVKNVVSGLQSGGGKLSGILKTLSERNQ
ncbi:MAG: 50S ribosomal protein L10 [Flavobacteriales bacterium]|nr:50S ribosomal protein L10 [Flavobacteriales bacterium]